MLHISSMITRNGWIASLILILMGSACSSPPAEQKTDSDIAYYFSAEGIVELRSRFHHDTISGWYEHSLWADSVHSQSGLSAVVHANGSYVLSSRYVGEEPISHRQVVVSIGKNTFSSAPILRTDPEHSEQYVGDLLVEINQYTNYRDGMILENIADAGEEAVIIRYRGKRAEQEAILTEAERNALIDCFQLAILNRMKKP